MNPTALTAVACVAIGGALGSLLRYGLGTFVSARMGGWPYGTFVINVIGSFLIGLFFALAGPRGWPDTLRYLIPIGFIGGFTTFSAYEYETYRLFESGRALAALGYIGASTFIGLAAVALGMATGKRI